MSASAATTRLRVLLALLACATPLAASAQGEDDPIFRCRVDGRRLTVTRDGTRLVYRFGERAATGDPAAGTLLHQRIPILDGEGHILRFRDGPTSDAVYGFFEVDLANHDSREEAGVLVLLGTRLVELWKCRPTDWRKDEDDELLDGRWIHDIDFDALPPDLETLYPLVWQSRYRQGSE